MIVTMVYPIALAQGALSQDYYVRVLHGQVVVQHKPRKSSAAQRAMRLEFGAKYGTARRVPTATDCPPST